MIEAELYDGKYKVVFDGKGNLYAERYGKPWRDMTGDGMVLAMLQEINRLRSMIQYALDGPEDWHALKSILFDTLNGCTGADNVEEVRAKHGMFQAGNPSHAGEGERE
jgi:hypothetical protein